MTTFFVSRSHWTLGSRGTPPIPPSWLPLFWASTLQVPASHAPFATVLTTPKPSAHCRRYSNRCARIRLPVPPIPGYHRRPASFGTEASVRFPLCPAHGVTYAHLVAAPTTEPGTVRTHHLTPVSGDGPQGHLDHPRIHLLEPPVVDPFGSRGLVEFFII